MAASGTARRGLGMTAALVVALALASCGRTGGLGDMFSRPSGEAERARAEMNVNDPAPRSTIWDLFANVQPPETTVQVNRYLWQAALEVLDFLPVQTVDPFSGVIVTGFGTPPGGGRSYRAAVLVNGAAMDARSLNVALLTSAGPASPATIRAVEDAILTRARQLRVRDGRL